MNRFVFAIDSEELVINAYSIQEAVAEIKQLMKVVGEERKLEFVGVKY